MCQGSDSLHGLHIWSIDSNDVFLSCHVCMDGSNGKVDSDKVIQNINEVLGQKHNIHHTVIQAETQDLCGMDVLCNK